MKIEKDDLKSLVDAILEFPVHLVGGDSDHFFCEYCGAIMDQYDSLRNFVHDNRCAVLVAERIKKELV